MEVDMHSDPSMWRAKIEKLQSLLRNLGRYDLATLERLATLAELELALDQAPLGNQGRRALCAVRPGRSLSLSFRYTERAQGLLAECGNLLGSLTHLDVGACRVGSEALFEAVAALTGLRELRMAVYANTDHSIHCQLSRLSRLEALQRFALEKRKAYFPEARRFGESSITVPVTAAGLGTLAARWTRLHSLRLALSRRDYNPESLAMLSSFTGLRELGLVVERYPGGGNSSNSNSSMVAGSPGAYADPQQLSTSAGAGAGAAGTTIDSVGAGGGGGAGGGIGCSPGSAGAGLGHGRLFRREPPPTLDLAWLPVGLQALELNSLLLELSAPPPEALPPPGGDDDETSPTPRPLPAPAARPPLPPTRVPRPRLPLSQLTCLDVESCVVRPPLLAEVARRCGSTLRSLRLAGVVGLTDAALADCLEQLPALRSLAISAAGNRAVTQACLAALSGGRRAPSNSSSSPSSSSSTAFLRLPLPLRGGPSLGPAHPLRALSLETDDLTSRGPLLAVLAPLSALRHLRLSCTDKTAERALGSLRVLQDALPYCHCDMVWTTPRDAGLD
eukprot:XP_001696304.1 predicted protein [Chlamydomonas reinhardtii]